MNSKIVCNMFVIKLWEINFVIIEMNVLKKVRNKISYIVKMERQGGLIINMGYTTVRYMTQKVSLILEIVTHLLGKVWHQINGTVWAKECDIKQNKTQPFSGPIDT